MVVFGTNPALKKIIPLKGTNKMDAMLNDKGQRDYFFLDLEYKRYLVRLILGIGIPFFGYFSITDFFMGRYVAASILALLLLFLVGGLFGVGKSKNEEREYRFYTYFFTLLMILLGVLFLYLIAIEGKLSRIPWFYVFPLLLFFTLGHRHGLFWMILMAGALLFFIYIKPTPEKIAIQELRNRFFLSLFLITFISFFIEKKRHEYQQRLFTHQRTLQESKKRLREAHDELEKRVNERTADLSAANQKLKREIEDRILAENALRESEEKYRLLVENANDAIFIAQDDVIKFPNPKTTSMVGYSDDELSRTPFINLIHPDDRDMVIDRHLRRLKGEDVATPYTFRVLHKAGGELWVELNAVLITWEGKPGTLNFLRDITGHKNLEAQLRQAQKMEAIGTLAGGIAHDFNNLLMGIQGRTSLMSMDSDVSHAQLEHLKGIQDHVQSAADLTRQLLGFARGGKYEVTPTDINTLLRRTSRMFGRTKKEINIHEKYAEDLWTVETDQAQIEQVLLNLYVNAWHAMPGGGELHLQTENVTLEAPFTKSYGVEPGRFVKISIADTGAGMDKKTRDRIFDPFFTTKEMGRGTGLGLASAYGIINNHGGIILVDSAEGEGSVFSIFLPASEKEVPLELPTYERILEGEETILLVDDEELVMGVAQQMLEKLGYRVIPAGNGGEALRIFEEERGSIDMVILDMIMPDMGGGEIFDRLKGLAPGVKVLLSSGYSIDGRATEIINRGCDGFIQKPFNIKALSHKIREILDRGKT